MTTCSLSLTPTLSERERALFRFFWCVSTSHLAHTHRGSNNESFIPPTCSCSCERFSSHGSPFLLHALPAALLPFPPALEPKERMDLSDEFLLSTITADHKSLSEESESRNSHRFSVVVQDLVTQWLQSFPCKTKTSQETHESPMKFLEPTWKPKVMYTDNSLEFGKSCEELCWNHCSSTRHRSQTNCLAEKVVRRKKGSYVCGIVALRRMKTCWVVLWDGKRFVVCEMTEKQLLDIF